MCRLQLVLSIVLMLEVQLGMGTMFGPCSLVGVEMWTSEGFEQDPEVWGAWIC